MSFKKINLLIINNLVQKKKKKEEFQTHNSSFITYNYILSINIY